MARSEARGGFTPKTGTDRGFKQKFTKGTKMREVKCRMTEGEGPRNMRNTRKLKSLFPALGVGQEADFQAADFVERFAGALRRDEFIRFQ